MCGCVDEMATVSRADCTEPDVDERFNVEIVGGEVQSIEQTRMDIDFIACTGRTNNDLVSYGTCPCGPCVLLIFCVRVEATMVSPT